MSNTGKKQKRAVSVTNKKSLEVTTKKPSTQRRYTKPKTAAEKQAKCRKPKSPDREKTRKRAALHRNHASPKETGGKRTHFHSKQRPMNRDARRNEAVYICIT